MCHSVVVGVRCSSAVSVRSYPDEGVVLNRSTETGWLRRYGHWYSMWVGSFTEGADIHPLVQLWLESHDPQLSRGEKSPVTRRVVLVRVFPCLERRPAEIVLC